MGTRAADVYDFKIYNMGPSANVNFFGLISTEGSNRASPMSKLQAGLVYDKYFRKLFCTASIGEA